MYQRFINGIDKGIPAKTLINPSKKEFIGKDVLSFMPNANNIFADIIKKIRKENTPNDIKPPQKQELEKLYGKLTYDQYKKTVEYQNYLKLINKK